MRKSRWVIFFVIIFISSLLLYALNDREKKPDIKTETNITKIQDMGSTAGVLNVSENTITYAKCPEDYVFLKDRNVCYKENPIGHTMITFIQVIAIIFTIATATVYDFKGWRTHLSSKILPYKNKYQDELRPITKSPDINQKKGFIWTRGGYDALLSGTDDNLYVARQDDAALIQNNIMLKGELQKVTAQTFYKWVSNWAGHDLQLLREMCFNPLIKINAKGRLQEIDNTLTIYITKPLPYSESKAFSSIRGSFDFGADRINEVLLSLFKMRRGLINYEQKLQKASGNMLDNARQMSETTANISDAVSKTKIAEISPRQYTPNPNESQQERRII